jgi:hypothetical protein
VQGYGPDGEWAEGPNYHGYSTRYFAPTVFSLLTAYAGNDTGLLSFDGVADTARFAVNMLAPDDQYFHWGDTHELPETMSQHLGLSAYFGDKATAWRIRQVINQIWVAPNETETTAMNYPVGLM